MARGRAGCVLHLKVQQISAIRSGRNLQCESHEITRLRSVLKLVEIGGFLRRKLPMDKNTYIPSMQRGYVALANTKLSALNGESITSNLEYGVA